MSRAVPSDQRDVSRIVEKQMRNWEIAQTIQPQHPVTPRIEVHPFISISRMFGSGGREVAVQLAQRLHWPLFDRELLVAMARDDTLRARLYDVVDEHDRGWFERSFEGLMDVSFSKEDYFHRLTEMVMHLARRGNAVFLGRATDLILPADAGFRVKLVASMNSCVERLMARRNVSYDEALEMVKRVERDRKAWVRRHFRRDPDDPMRHDVVIHTDRFTLDQTAELITHGIRMKLGVVST